MISRTTLAFRERLAALPAEIQQQARAAFQLFQQNPAHPSLHYKTMRRRGTILHYRVLAYEEGSTLYWFWIGPHAEYDHLLDRL
jgi:hypothetical protein